MKYQQLTKEERYLMGHELSMGSSLRAIARKLDRSPATISREKRRNVDPSDGSYRYQKADRYSRARRRRCRQGPNYQASEVELVHTLIERQWSPEQISGRLQMLGELTISTSTIYRWVKRDRSRGGQLWQQTRRLSHRYRKGYRVKDSRGRLKGKTPITDRSEVINSRQEIGHWEGDTVMGSDGRHCVLTLVERKTRLVRIVKLEARKVVNVNRALAREFGYRGKLLIKSLTLDNGTEFHGYAALQKRYGKDFYFAAPYHSWERGTNENTNGLIRQYLPKGSCFKDLTQRQCNAIEKTLNDRPRKTLGYQTPAEAYYAECCT
jgi:IS30 family transposase